MQYIHWPSLTRMAWALVLAILLALVITPGYARPTSPGTRTFVVEASSYEYRPATLRVRPGEQVTLILTSLDYVHGIFIEGYDVELVADPGQRAQVTFLADKQGTFRMRCSVTCGPMHPFMVGKLIVGNGLLWLQAGALALAAALIGLRRGRR